MEPKYICRRGKGSNLTLRITGDLRAALEAEAARTGSSMSQVGEQWMFDGQRLNALIRAVDRLGGGS